MKRYILGALFLILCFLVLRQEAYAFSVEPARIELSIAPGRQRGRTVTIDNSRSDESLHLKIYMQDVVFLPDGTNDFPAAGSTSWSCANWVTVIPEEIDVPAAKTRNVRINISVPLEAKGGYYGMLFFESSSAVIQGLGINFRIGGLVDVTVSGSEERMAKLANISFDNNKQGIGIDIFNEGNVLMRPKGRIKILDARGKKIRELQFNPEGWGVLPKSMRKFYTSLNQPLAKGEYRLRAEIDYGTKYLIVGELSITAD